MKKPFYDSVRASLFNGTFEQSQFLGMEAIGLAFEKYGNGDQKDEAYQFATAFHETGSAMRPVYEFGPRAYFHKYEPGTRLGAILGNTTPGDGWLFRGRGPDQLTGRGIYRRVGKLMGLPLESHPDLAMQLDISMRILVQGTLGGWFTGVGIHKYAEFDDYHRFIQDRRAVNGQDRAELIAGYAMKFESAIRAS